MASLLECAMTAGLASGFRSGVHEVERRASEPSATFTAEQCPADELSRKVRSKRTGIE